MKKALMVAGNCPPKRNITGVGLWQVLTLNTHTNDQQLNNKVKASASDHNIETNKMRMGTGER